MKTFRYKNTDLYYEVYGESANTAVVLLHGYLESSGIWKHFAEELKDEVYILVPDIPGHGSSGIFSHIHSMDEIADSLNLLLDNLAIKHVHLIGHSLGGYITLAFLQMFPQRLISYTLFHSHCYADSDEKKLDREREIELVKEGKKNLIINTNIPRLFAEHNLIKFSVEVEESKSIAMTTPAEGMIAILKGMKNRPDRSHLLKTGKVPGLLISGDHDILIPSSINEKMISSAANMSWTKLPGSGHMGFIEEKDLAVLTVKNFILQFKTTL